MTDPAKGEVVPFGKYKGQPVEVLLADQGYRDWLMAQDWFRNRFGAIYQTVINYGAEPQETPEHNEMQAAFLDDDRCFRLAQLLYPNHPYDREAIRKDRSWAGYGQALAERFRDHLRAVWEDAYIDSRQFEAAGWDVVYYVEPASLQLQVISLPPCACGPCNHSDCLDKAPCRGGDPSYQWACQHRYHKPRGVPQKANSVYSTHCDRACPWSDFHTAKWLLNERDSNLSHYFQPGMPGMVRIECKPDLGDDFPAVLRQVLRYDREHGDRCCVLVRRPHFERVTWDQVAAMFKASNIVLLREADLLAAAESAVAAQPKETP
jgi:hypothetical protein